MMIQLEQIREALHQVMDPELPRNIVDLGMVQDLTFQAGVVSFTVALTTMACPLKSRIADDARRNGQHARTLSRPAASTVGGGGSGGQTTKTDPPTRLHVQLA